MHPRIVCAYPGVPRSRESPPLAVVTYDGGGWSAPQSFSSSALLSAPALASFEGVLHLPHRIASEQTALIEAFFDGTTWHHDEVVVYEAMASPPDAAVRGEALYAIFQPAGAPGQLIAFRRSAGSTWEAPIPPTQDAHAVTIPAVVAPAAATLGNAIHVVYAGASGGRADGSLRWRTLVGDRWSPELPIANVRTSGATPSAVAFGGELYVFHPEGISGQQLCYSVLGADGRWQATRPIQVAGLPVTGGGSAAVVYGGRLHLLYRTTAGTLAVVAFDGRTWSSPPQPSAPIRLPCEPAAAVYSY